MNFFKNMILLILRFIRSMNAVSNVSECSETGTLSFLRVIIVLLQLQQQQFVLGCYSTCDLCKWNEISALASARGALCCVTCKPAMETKQPVLHQNKSCNLFQCCSPPLTAEIRNCDALCAQSKISLSQTHRPLIFSFDIPRTYCGDAKNLLLSGCNNEKKPSNISQLSFYYFSTAIPTILCSATNYVSPTFLLCYAVRDIQSVSCVQ